jgi:hypothetical protein
LRTPMQKPITPAISTEIPQRLYAYYSLYRNATRST